LLNLYLSLSFAYTILSISARVGALCNRIAANRRCAGNLHELIKWGAMTTAGEELVAQSIEQRRYRRIAALDILVNVAHQIK
jgi:hypothetical protein